MSHKVIIAFIWFPITAIFLMLDLLFLNRIAFAQKKHESQSKLAMAKTQVVTDIADNSEQVLGATIIAGDARETIIRNFLQKHSSPMTDFSSYIVERADTYGIDYRLVSAIGMCESNVGKRMPEKSRNMWGISVYDGQNSGATFPNWLYAIDWVSKYIKTEYKDKGLKDPIAMGAKWAPSSVLKGNSWANCVNFFLDEIEQLNTP